MKQETLDELAAIVRRLNVIIAENTKIVQNRPLNTELADKIIVHTAAHYGFTHEQILSRDKYESIAHARFVCIYMVDELINPKLSLQQIAKIFKRSSHKSIQHALKYVCGLSPTHFKYIISLEEKVRLAINVQNKTEIEKSFQKGIESTEKFYDQPILPT